MTSQLLAANLHSLFIVCLVEYLKDVLEKKNVYLYEKTKAEANLYMLRFFGGGGLKQKIFFLSCFKLCFPGCSRGVNWN